MAAKEKLEAALNEARMMALGGQVVLGFQFNAIFQPKFSALPFYLKYMNACGVGLLIAALTLLLAPVPYHRLVEGGDATERMHAYTTAMAALAPLPFATAIGMDVIVVSNTRFGILIAVALTTTALFLWYGVELMKRKSPSPNQQSTAKADMHEKIKTINTEARIILPGVQALLGFQFSAFLTEAFDKLPEQAKQVHFVGLVALALAVILLMAPPAYHRIAARGNDRPDVDRFSVLMVLSSLIPLSIGMSADLYLVVGIVSDWAAWTAAVTLGNVVLTLAFWFGYPLWIKRGQSRET